MNLEGTIKELKELSNKDGVSVSKIEWWLLKYDELYKRTYDFVYSQHLVDLEDGSTMRLPPCINETDEEKFLDLYDALDEVCSFNKDEGYFEQELITYHNISDSKDEVIDWVKKNKYFGADKYIGFLDAYLYYSKDPNYLYVDIISMKIYIDQKDFINTIEFLEIFNELYYEQEILQENL